MDIFCDHALTCSCNGDRTVRQNALRNEAHRYGKAAGVNPVKEKPELLAPRPGADTIRETSASNGRRPADIWLPQFQDSEPAALDFAVTSGLKADMLQQSAIDATRVLNSYEDGKRQYQNTADQCRQVGLQFLPMVVKAHSGAWGTTAKGVWTTFAKSYATSAGVPTSEACAILSQRLSTTLHRVNARAVLRRLSVSEPGSADFPHAVAWSDALDLEDSAMDLICV